MKWISQVFTLQGRRHGPPAACRRLSSGVGGGAGSHQTPIVDMLWQLRRHSVEQEQIVEAKTVVRDRLLVTKQPQDSHTFVDYNFGGEDDTARRLADQYKNPWGKIRVGRFLEDLDALAGTIAYKHCKSDVPGIAPQHIVTASVDRIKFMHRADLRDNIRLSGFVSWVGRSSMEIRMQACSSWTDQPFVESIFTFVARDPATGKASAINPLAPSSECEKEWFAAGAAADDKRKERRKQQQNNNSARALNEEEMMTARALMTASEPLRTMPALADPNDILLDSTRLQNALVCQYQHRNTAGRVFGGFLMRRAFELAFATAYLFGGLRPQFLELDEVTFQQPVSIGDLLRLESAVLYTSCNVDPAGKQTVHIAVEARVSRPETRTAVVSNTFAFTFGLDPSLDEGGERGEEAPVRVRRVLPGTLEQAMQIVERYQQDMVQKQQDLQDGVERGGVYH